eukprot:2733208-Amphidinium_carterae.1
MSNGWHNDAEGIAQQCCIRLQIQGRGTEKLVHGTEVVPATARVHSWPGLSRGGERVPARPLSAVEQLCDPFTVI